MIFCGKIAGSEKGPDPDGSGHNCNNLNRWKIVEFFTIIEHLTTSSFYLSMFLGAKLTGRPKNARINECMLSSLVRMRKCSATNRNRGWFSKLTRTCLPNVKWNVCFLFAALHFPIWRNRESIRSFSEFFNFIWILKTTKCGMSSLLLEDCINVVLSFKKLKFKCRPLLMNTHRKC